MKQITIQIHDPYRYAEVALLVDQPWLEPIILKIRSGFGINALFPYERYDDFYLSLIPIGKSKLIDEKIRDMQSNFITSFKEDVDFAVTQNQRQLIHDASVIYSKQSLFEISIISELQQHIKDIDKVREIVKKAIVTGEVGNDDLQYLPNKRINPDSIERDRKMYWMKMRNDKNLTTQDISDLMKKSNELIEPNSVSKQVQSYIERLEKFSI